MERAIAFYTGCLGLPLRLRVGKEWAELDAGKGFIIGLHLARPPETVAAGTPGAFNIELAATRNLDDVVAELRERGVAFKGEIQAWPAVRLAIALDPDGSEPVLAQVLDAGAPS
jgi:catechol 2,3-dioxygenase-like lactoylglutathione lyase family enzyme